MDLGGFWKPDEETKKALARAEHKKKISKKNWRRKLKGKKPLSRKQRLLFAPGHVFYRSKRWRELRRRVFRHYGYRCMSCRAVDTEMHVDHIKPRSKHPHLSLTFENLQVLCKDCNMEKSNKHAKDYREQAVTESLDELVLAGARERGL